MPAISQTQDLQPLMQQLRYQFKEPALLERALRHRSCGTDHNERLEFLGDAILSFIIASDLFERFPQAEEGLLSRLRASLVNEAALVKLARQFDLQRFVALGPGEVKTGGADRPSTLSDCLEAVVGAIYLDSSIDVCRHVILDWYRPLLEKLTLKKNYKDPKSTLQELLQGKNLPRPEYRLLESEGVDHKKLFRVACRVLLLDHDVVAQATSIRKAEQLAASMALSELSAQKEPGE